jgi:hypothetical protein
MNGKVDGRGLSHCNITSALYLAPVKDLAICGNNTIHIGSMPKSHNPCLIEAPSAINIHFISNLVYTHMHIDKETDNTFLNSEIFHYVSLKYAIRLFIEY